MTYEQRMIAQMRQQDIALARILRGDKGVDITKSDDLFYQVNKDRVSIDEFTNRAKFQKDAAELKEFKKDLIDQRFGKTKSGHGRLIGEMPAEIYFARKEFSSPEIPREERIKNMKKWFNDFPAFRIGDKRV